MGRYLRILVLIGFLVILLFGQVVGDPLYKVPDSDGNLAGGLVGIDDVSYFNGYVGSLKEVSGIGVKFRQLVATTRNGRITLINLHNPRAKKDLGPGYDPWFSPNGKKLLYAVGPLTNPNLYELDLASNRKILLAKNACKPCWRRDVITFIRQVRLNKHEFAGEVWCIDKKGERRVRARRGESWLGYPQLSLDARLVIVEGYEIVDLATGEVKRFNPDFPIYGLFQLLRDEVGRDLVLYSCGDSGPYKIRYLDGTLYGTIRSR